MADVSDNARTLPNFDVTAVKELFCFLHSVVIIRTIKI